MNEQERYVFDLKGYLVIRGALDPAHVAALNATIDTTERLSDDDVPPPVRLQREVRGSKDMRIHNVKELGEPFERLIDLEPIVSLVQDMIGSRIRLNHDYAILRYHEGDRTFFHLGNTPVTPSCQFRVHDGHFFSTLVKVVFPLTDQAVEDGCFSVVPGSHKSNFPNPYGNDPEDNVIREPVPCRAGDAVIFTEALTHGSEVNRTGKPRRTLYYAYSPAWMTDWTRGDAASPTLMERATERRRELLTLSQMSGQRG
jgi:ectoine hydroxylase-related dioxygenase (phytanoyl-CoA dioxygenase family)